MDNKQDKIMGSMERWRACGACQRANPHTLTHTYVRTDRASFFLSG